MKLGQHVVFSLVAFGALGGCSDDSPHPDRQRDTPNVAIFPSDGGVGGAAVVLPPGVDPSAVHIDDVGSYRQPAPQPLPAREKRAIDVTLRSTPPGALAAVDGTPVGPTPAFWSGYADGREHQFVFTLPGHAIARYRFVPVSSGVIHARLEPILVERDAGIAPPPELVPQHQPSAVVPPAAPPTLVTPDAPPVAPQMPPGIPAHTPGSAGTPGSVPAPGAPTPTPTPVGPQP